jgi:hypothetical protein
MMPVQPEITFMSPMQAFERRIIEQVASSPYTTASEVVGAAPRPLEQIDVRHAAEATEGFLSGTDPGAGADGPAR